MLDVLGSPVTATNPIRGTFFGCCASAGVQSANKISATRNRFNRIGPSDRKVRGLNTATLKHLPLSLAPKSHCGEAPACVLIIFLMDDRWTTWKLRCQSCHKTFDLTLKTAERIIDYAKKEPCPRCHVKPSRTKGLAGCHQIIGFSTIDPLPKY
jgi:hypothetical protein